MNNASRLLLLFALLSLAGCSTDIIRPDRGSDPEDEPDPQVEEEEEAERRDWTSISDRGLVGPRDVLLLQDGSTIVFGLALEVEGTSCAVERFDPGGSSLGVTRFATSGGGLALRSANAATLGADGEVVILCAATLGDGSPVTWLGWLDASGTLIAETELSGILGNDLVHSGEADEVVIVGADHRTPETGIKALYQHVAIGGPTTPEHSQASSFAGAQATMQSIARRPDGGMVVTKVDTVTSGGVIDAQLVMLDGASIVDVAAKPCAALVAVGPSGAIYTAGNAFDGSGTILCKHTRVGATWSVDVFDLDIPESITFGITALATDGYGNVIVGGYVEPEDTSVTAEMFSRAYAPTGEVLWHDTYRGADGEFAFGLALGASGGRVVEAGVVVGSAYPYSMAVKSVTR